MRPLSELVSRASSSAHETADLAEHIDEYNAAQAGQEAGRAIKEANIKWLKEQPNFSLHEANLINADLNQLLKDVDIVFHEAAQAGVRASWGKKFHIYTENNTELIIGI